MLRSLLVILAFLLACSDGKRGPEGDPGEMGDMGDDGDPGKSGKPGDDGERIGIMNGAIASAAS